MRRSRYVCVPIASSPSASLGRGLAGGWSVSQLNLHSGGVAYVDHILGDGSVEPGFESLLKEGAAQMALALSGSIFFDGGADALDRLAVVENVVHDEPIISNPAVLSRFLEELRAQLLLGFLERHEVAAVPPPGGICWLCVAQDVLAHGAEDAIGADQGVDGVDCAVLEGEF